MPRETILNWMLAAQAGGEAACSFEMEHFPSARVGKGSHAARMFYEKVLVAYGLRSHSPNPIELGVNIAAILSLTFNKRFQ
jgi:hypothetical protein